MRTKRGTIEFLIGVNEKIREYPQSGYPALWLRREPENGTRIWTTVEAILKVKA
jgi:hypothetical protein